MFCLFWQEIERKGNPLDLRYTSEVSFIVSIHHRGVATFLFKDGWTWIFFSYWIAVFSKLIFSNLLNTLALLSWSWTASRYFSLQVIWKKGVLFGIAFLYLIFWADYPYIKLISNGNIEVSNNFCCCWVDTKWDWYPYSVICDY